jgi:hypothetical protein
MARRLIVAGLRRTSGMESPKRTQPHTEPDASGTTDDTATSAASTSPGVGSYDPSRQPTEAQHVAFGRIHRFFNERLFDGALPPVMLTFARSGKYLGYFATRRWQPSDGGDPIHEIVLNPDFIAARGHRDAVSTIVHEMAHQWQEVFGHPSRRGYHNAEWAAEMERIGLVPSATGLPGGKKTGQRMTHYIEEGGPFAKAFEAMPDDWLLPFIGLAPLKETAKGQSKTKFTCPGCGVNVWGKPDLRVMCVDCQEEFQSHESAKS